jgi:FMN-dependent oxidoreductase (nitrilotriacetate monooxygenase family)
MTKHMHLAFDLSYIHLDGRWRMPGAWTGRTYPSLDIFEEIARIAERGCIDLIFFGDGTGIPSTWKGSRDEAVRWGISWPRHDMSPVITAMSRVTKKIGFCLTYSSTFMHPFYVARLMNSLDHVTDGRVAFNVITSTRRADAANYGFDALMEHTARYERMEEFVDVCFALWDSVAPDAFAWDRESGIVADPEKVHAIDHRGEFFQVMGPLNVVPSPQVRPVMIQAGSSPRGIQASAHFAELVFANSQTPEARLRHRRALDEALVAAGRDPASVGIVWATTFIVGETAAEAAQRKESLLSMIPREAVGAYLSHNVGYDFATLPARFTLGDLNRQIAETQASPVGFVHQLAVQLGAETEITREEFFEYGVKNATSYDRTVCGTAAEVADRLEETFVAQGERGGFMFAHPQVAPRDLLGVVDYLVPELQRRGRFRREYMGDTLRANLIG